jgi:hypothetical protein
LLRNSWQRLNAEQAFVCNVDPDEFTSLLKSGRKQDMDLLARKLSRRRDMPGSDTTAR